MSGLMKVSVECCDDRRTLESLRTALMLRQQLLANETQEQAVRATAINVLRSLKAETKVVGRKPKIIADRWAIQVKEAGYLAGWATPGKSNPRGRRVVRKPGGHSLDRLANAPIVNLQGAYRRGEAPRVWLGSVTNLLSQNKTPWYVRYFVANSAEEVEQFLRRRVERRIGQFRGINKRAIGIAQHLIAGSATTSNSSESSLQKLAGRLVHARVMSHGSECTALVADSMPTAMLALRSGPASLQMALQRAANATVSIINKRLDLPLDKRLPTPFREIVRKGAAA